MSEQVNHPAHYNQGEIETIDVWDSMGIGEEGCLSNVIKYAMRYRFKHDEPELQLLDLEKAAWYLNRIIEKRSGRVDGKPSIDHLQLLAWDLTIPLNRFGSAGNYASKARTGYGDDLKAVETAIYEGGVRDVLEMLLDLIHRDEKSVCRWANEVLNSLTV